MIDSSDPNKMIKCHLECGKREKNYVGNEAIRSLFTLTQFEDVEI